MTREPDERTERADGSSYRAEGGAPLPAEADGTSYRATADDGAPEGDAGGESYREAAPAPGDELGEADGESYRRSAKDAEDAERLGDG